MYSDSFMVAVGCFIRLILVLCSMPILIWVLIYRKLKNKSNKFLTDWILN